MEGFVYIQYNGNEKLNGLVSYIRSKYPEEIPSDVINTFSSGEYRAQDVASNTLYENDYVYTSPRGSGMWIAYHFPGRLIHLVSYSIKVTQSSIYEGDHYPRCWTIKGSKNNITWKDLHVQQYTEIFKERGQTETFSCSKNTNSAYSFIKILNQCKSSNDEKYLRIHQVEFFGTLFLDHYDLYKEGIKTCNCNKYIPYNIGIFLILILCFNYN